MKTESLSATIRRTTQAMANTPAYVGMDLWCEHSNAVLQAANEIDQLHDTLQETRKNWLAFVLSQKDAASRVAETIQLAEANSAYDGIRFNSFKGADSITT